MTIAVGLEHGCTEFANTTRQEPFPVTDKCGTLADFNYDGRKALAAVVASSAYGTLGQAVASLTLFTHPATIAQIPGGGALFPAVRDFKRRRTLGFVGERQVGFDDNEVAHHVFRWCNPRMAIWRDVQLNHIWSRSSDADCFTAPANLCAAPSFLAKLTDHDESTGALLRRRAFDLYGWRPADEAEPPQPLGYAELNWAEPLPPVANLEAELRRQLIAKPRSTASQIACEIGWAFNNFRPDPTIPAALSRPEGAD